MTSPTAPDTPAGNEETAGVDNSPDKSPAVQVEVRNLSKSFGRVKAVRQANFSFYAGEVCGFIGPNGAGKTTTMRMIAALLEPDAGDILINGVSALDYPDLTCQQLGFMPDYIDSYRRMLVSEYLDFYVRAYRLPIEQRRRRLNDVIEFCQLAELVEQPVTGLSKGMKQRLSLGRVLLNDPKALILDEPAAGLDPHARIELRRLIRLLADNGKAVLISSHILSELSEICDTVVIIDKGVVRKSGAVESIHKDSDEGGRLELILAEPNERELRRLEAELARLGGVERLNLTPAGAGFNFARGEKERAKLLAQLLAQNFQIADFHLLQSNLEEAFMNYTGSANNE